jgi:hypothetical protein
VLREPRTGDTGTFLMGLLLRGCRTFFEFAGARVGKEAKGTGRQRLKSAARWGLQKNAYDGYVCGGGGGDGVRACVCV